MSFEEASSWDRQLRCKYTLECGESDSLGMVMILREQWNCKYELDGSVLVHLATEDRRHAVCDGSELYNVGAAQPGTLMRQCQACLHQAMK
jgi:hypothetical protein